MLIATQDNASKEADVARLYEDRKVATTYLEKRFSYSWSALLNRRQIGMVNWVIEKTQPSSILEVAPGPARIATGLDGVQKGVMIEYNEEMRALAKHRLALAGLATVWDVRKGNAFELEDLGEQFDFIYTFRFIRHFQDNERARLYQGISKCLFSGGLFLLDVVNQTTRQRLDAGKQDAGSGDLNIFDATYTRKAFEQEITSHDFELVRFEPVIKHFSIQSWLSYRLDHRLPFFSRTLVTVLEHVPSLQPLEWMALCRKAV